jgi:cytochrome c peroxidase
VGGEVGQALPLCGVHFGGFTILLTAAAAQDAALLKQAQEIFQPLSEDLASAALPTTRERIELGRSLFFDPRLTIDANMSCSSCHQPAFYGTDTLPRAIGVKQRPHPRNAPTVLNTGALQIVHWRGDRESLEDQVAKAVTSPITSGQPDEKGITDRLSRVSGYAPLFAAAFPNDPQPITIENIANAISAYERTLLTPSLFDAYLAGNQEALSPTAWQAWRNSSTPAAWHATTASASVAACTRSSASWKTIGRQPAATPSTGVEPKLPRIPPIYTCSGLRACATWR